MRKFYNEKIETINSTEKEKLQLALINTQIKQALKAPYYQDKKLKQISGLSDIKNLPFTGKEDLRKAFPFKMLAIPHDQIVRFNASSGTTGIPTLAYFSKSDIKAHEENEAVHFFRAGVRKNTTFQLMSSLGLFAAGWCCLSGTSKIGASLIPSGYGNTERQIDLLLSLNADCCFSTPGYLQHLLEMIPSKDLEDIKLKTAITGGEPLSKNFQKMAFEKYGIEIYNFYGMTEVASHIASECSFHNGLHIAEDHFYIEIIDPDTGKVLPDGEYGELVVTPLKQEAMPLIRYRTRDITRIIKGNCPCGCTHRRIEPITHRIDDMMIINGVNVFPSQIEECIYRILPHTTNWQIEVEEKQFLKKIKIIIELQDELLSNETQSCHIRLQLINELKAHITVTPLVEFVTTGTLPEITGKAKRVKFVNRS